MSDYVSIESPGEVLPTLPGKVSGVVAFGRGITGKSWMTVQCATCLRTATGAPIFAANWANFGGDGDSSSEYNPRGPRRPYRRCSDCQKAARHPEVEGIDIEEPSHG